MSHIPLRKEKDCLNCGTIVQGRYCHQCGQENVVPKETFWHMVAHFFYDITHFDSSFFHTVHHLILKPGFLSKEYMKGRRSKYLHPIRMYVFSSAIFFLLIFTVFKKDEVPGLAAEPLPDSARVSYIQKLEAALRKDSTNENLKERLSVAKNRKEIYPYDTILTTRKGIQFNFSKDRYKSVEEYDSVQNSLPKEKRDSWLTSRVIRKVFELDSKFREDPQEAGKKLMKSAFHRLPYMLFISLPLFSFILYVVYIRRRKEFYFADHGVFTIHLYVFSFIMLLFATMVDWLNQITGWTVFEVMMWLIMLGMVVYLYKAMRNFYGQRRAKTVIKFILVSIFSLLMMLILFIGIMIFSAATF